MGPTTKHSLRVETRRRGFLLWLDSLEVLGESPVVGIAVNGASHGLSNDGQSRLDTPSVCALHSGPQARDLLDPALATADKAAPRNAQARTSRARADSNKATTAEEYARVGQVAFTARGGDGERSRHGERGR